MREIKFRAWDKNAKAMRDVSDLYISGSQIVYRHGARQSNVVRFYSEIALMQYTGLKDKNGKEIYEGDICKWRSHPNPTDTSEVIFEGGRFCFKVQNELEKERGFYTMHGLVVNMVEVIGNIYENPELLDTQDKGGKV